RLGKPRYRVFERDGGAIAHRSGVQTRDVAAHESSMQVRVTIPAFEMDVDMVTGHLTMHAFDQDAGCRGVDDSDSFGGAEPCGRDTVFAQRLAPHRLPPISGG